MRKKTADPEPRLSWGGLAETLRDVATGVAIGFLAVLVLGLVEFLSRRLP